jgi:predicted transposase YbfD/YdcC
MPDTMIPLVAVFVEMPDWRDPRGRRYSLAAVLALACAAMLCGYRSYSAMAEWGRNYGQALARQLGFATGVTPCAATLHTIFRKLDVAEFERRLGRWAEAALAADPPAPVEAIAIDGKTLRGSAKQGAPGAHLLSAVSHRLGLTLAQVALADKAGEQSHLPQVLAGLVLDGRIVTVDALHTQRAVAQAIIDAGGDYIMLVKENQPELHADIATLFSDLATVQETLTQAQTTDAGHGRIETRTLIASTALVGYSDWPGLQQVFRLEHTVRSKKTGVQHHETTYGVTSLSQPRADARRLLLPTRGHWRVEAGHWIRDVTFDEDRSQVRCGHIPQVMAALRNTTITVLRCAGESNIAAACRRLAAQPTAALALIGIRADN